MLAKKYRLPIQSVIGKKEWGKLKTPFFLIKIFSNQFSYARFGIIISKKVAPKATARNRIKRIIFSACNPKENAGKDFLIIANPKIKELGKEEIKKLLNKFLAEATKFI